jgi:hypothetical protein
LTLSVGWPVDRECIAARSTTLPDCSWQVCAAADPLGTLRFEVDKGADTEPSGFASLPLLVQLFSVF